MYFPELRIGSPGATSRRPPMAPEPTAEATEAVDEAPAGQAKRPDGQARR